VVIDQIRSQLSQEIVEPSTTHLSLVLQIDKDEMKLAFKGRASITTIIGNATGKLHQITRMSLTASPRAFSSRAARALSAAMWPAC
jgi:hypothetical protein